MNWSQFNLARVAKEDGAKGGDLRYSKGHGSSFDARTSLDLGMGSQRSNTKELRKKQVVLRKHNLASKNFSQSFIKSL